MRNSSALNNISTLQTPEAKSIFSPFTLRSTFSKERENLAGRILARPRRAREKVRAYALPRAKKIHCTYLDRNSKRRGSKLCERTRPDSVFESRQICLGRKNLAVCVRFFHAWVINIARMSTQRLVHGEYLPYGLDTRPGISLKEGVRHRVNTEPSVARITASAFVMQFQVLGGPRAGIVREHPAVPRICETRSFALASKHLKQKT